MYLAAFASDGGGFLTAAFRWQAPAGAVVPAGWSRVLLTRPACDFALRVTSEAKGSQVLLLVSAGSKARQELQEVGEALLRAGEPRGLQVANDAKAFDDVAGSVPPWQMRVNHEGYQHAGEALACDFRLYPVVTRDLGERQTVYQAHFRAYRADSETERRVRKYLAWLDIAQPFSDRVRALQRVLAQRLLGRGFRTCEHLAVQDADSLERWWERLRSEFHETTGRTGFPEPPLERGDFTDWLTSGHHPTRDTTAVSSVPAEGAAVFTEQESALLLSTPMRALQSYGMEATASPARPDVFISYASGDAAYATAACGQLEEGGLMCWIAPRDIDRDSLPYPEAIARALAQTRAVVVLVSDTANLSVHIPRELDLALERKLCIVPVRLQDVLPAGQLNYLLRTCQWLNAYGRDFRDAIEELRTRLRRLLG